ncbi:MAG: acyl-CoA dehydrogenase [Syntrophaceae bacterium]|nr:acyl-CoA dehydrogenase [Syntrophaceae bacterium]
MDFRLTEEQEVIRDTIRRFIARECTRDAAREADTQGGFPEKLYRPLADNGFCGLVVPEAYGGGGRNVLAAALIVEELSAVYPALAGAFAACAFGGGKNLGDLGSPEQKERHLPFVVDGSALFAGAILEPDGGYGRFAAGMTAVPDGDGFLLNGTKQFVRLAGRAAAILTLARTGPGNPPREGLSFFLVDAKKPGIAAGTADLVGTASLGIGEVRFENVAVSREDVLGGPEGLNRGWEQWAVLQEAEHLEIAACGLGIAQGAYDYAVQYAKERVQFGRPIIAFSAVKDMLVDMAVRIRAARLVARQAACLADEEKRCAAEAATARILAVETARKASMDCVQVLGGYGYTMEYDAQRYVRDALVLFGGAGPQEMLREDLGELLGLG